MKRKEVIFLICIMSGSLFVIVPKINASINKLDYVDGAVIQSVNATNSIVSSSSSLSHNLVTIGDGKISSIWNDIPGTPIFSYGNGLLKSFYDQSNVYFLISEKPDISWSAIQWDSLGVGYKNITPMETHDDIWIFGTTPHHEYGDAYSVGYGSIPQMDKINNLAFEKVLINDSNGNVKSIDWEISRKLVDNDYAGHDIQFNNTKTNYTVLFASSAFHLDLSKITRATFVFSNLTLGQTVATSTTITSKVILVDRFLYTQFELGLLVGIVMIGITLYIPTLFKMYRRK